MATRILAMRNGEQIPLDRDRYFVGRSSLDQANQRTVGELLKESARADREWIFLPDLCVSRRHAILTRVNEDEYAIEDAGSRSGTYVNGQVIREKTTLTTGDKIKIGQSTLEYFDRTNLDTEMPWEPLGSD